MTTWLVLLVLVEAFLLLAIAVEWHDRRERARMTTHHCRPGCSCRGAIPAARRRA